jgi:hypothetical protein
VAFFDSAWSRSVYPSSLDCNVNSIFFRRVNGSSSSNRYAPPSCWPRVPVRQFTTTVAAVLNNFPVVHTIRIHGIYDKDRSVLYGMSFLLALQIVVTAICCAFYRCEFDFPSSLVPRLTLQSCTIVGQPGMHRWSEAWLGWYILGLSHSLVHCFGMTPLPVLVVN